MRDAQLGHYDEGRFPTHHSKSPNRGSKKWNIIFIVVIVAGGGLGYWFWTDTSGQIGHVEKQDALAIPSAYVLSVRGAPQEAIGPLEKALAEGESPYLRAFSARALGTVDADRKDVVEALGQVAELSDEPENVRVACIEALGEHDDPRAKPYLKHILISDDTVPCQAAACISVGKIGITSLIPLLIEKLKSKGDRKLYEAAQKGLELIAGEGVSFGLDHQQWQDWYEKNHRPRAPP